jgi:HK97 family phage major capsid protein
MSKVIEMRRQRADLLDQARKLADGELTTETRAQADGLIAQADQLEQDIQREERLQAMIASKMAPAHNKIGRGDTEERAWCHFIRTGDDGGLREWRASNATDMNITTEADGGYLVPVGHYQGIIARRDQADLTTKLGLMPIPGKGTTVNIPVENEDDGEFVATNESGQYDLDAPAINRVQSTLVKYSKRVVLTVELMRDEDSNLMAFLNNFIGRGVAKTRNALLLTEVAANGTALKTFTSATVIAVDELEALVYNDNLDAYLDDGPNVGWVMKPSVHGEIVNLDDSSTRRYAANQQGAGRSLLGYAVNYTDKSGATAASAKSVYFGNWSYVGYREGAAMTMLRDPYTRGGYGEVCLYYLFDVDYNVLQAEAIGYGVHPSA